jgi:hypothetical protein
MEGSMKLLRLRIAGCILSLLTGCFQGEMS